MRASRYSENEITRMVEQYAALKARADTKPGHRLDTLVRLADLDGALDRLPMDLWRVMLVHGLLGVTRDESAVALKISTGAVSKRYRLALEELHYTMNGGT